MNWMMQVVIGVAMLTPTYLIRFKIFGLPTTVLECLIALLCIATIMRAVFFINAREEYQKKIISIPRSLMIGVAGFFIAGCISVFVAPDLNAAAGIWRAYIFDAMLFGLIAWLHIKSLKEFQIFAWMISVVAMGVAVYAIVQKFTGWGIPNPFWRAVETRRVTSIFGYPNAVGLYLELVIPFFVASFFLARDGVVRAWATRVWFGSVIIAVCLAVFFAESSGTVTALAGTVGIFLLCWKKTRVATIIFGVVCVMIIIFSPLRKPFADEFLLQGFSGRLRTQMWKETVEMLQPRFVQGAGLAGYQARVKPFHVFTWAEIYLYPHNLVLTLWSELGLLGLFSFGWIFGLVFFWAVRAVRVPNALREQCVWACAIVATLLIIFIHGLVDIPYFKNDFAALFWLTVAMSLHIRYTQLSLK